MTRFRVAAMLAAALLLLPGPARAEDPAGKVEARLRSAEALAAARRFAAAADALDAAFAEATDPKDLLRIGARQEEIVLARDGLEVLLRAVREHPERFTAADLGTGQALDLVAADAEGLEARLAAGRSRLPWSSVAAVRLAALVERARPGPTEWLPVAQMLHEAGAREGAERGLLAALKAGADAREVSRRLAKWRGEPVPEGGYVEQDGRLVAPTARDRTVLDRRVAEALARVDGRDPEERHAAVEELVALGGTSREPLLRALRARWAATAREATTHPALASPKVRAGLVAEVEKRRAAALAVIEDPVAYPYPSPDHKGQAEVDRLVGLVREAWERPADLVAAWEPSFAQALALVAEADGLLRRADPDNPPEADAVRAASSRAVDVPRLLPDEYCAKALAYNERVPASVTPEERDCVLAVNEYRRMMGRPAVKVDERLVRAARGHSIHMRRNGYFAHDNATPGLETPGKRAARQGYGGGVGENIAVGPSTGRQAFDGWFHSSGHHRNMLGARWTDIGCGRSGTLWTQLFGGAGGRGLDVPKDSLPPPGPDCAPEPDPR